ncbi:hypothetical protein I3843_03G053700 [Carya illinoinensis]|uniref:Uncharacterized protein n=1 Tax=Carya illinoinensis TaxID=32201 RepID=A0A8T1R049_CARIL|nr:uncharacterized protein LOC122303660 [Carya illinoinensis]KAG6659744.1 hypothetical protein CIPAW_03G057300 [Carya illinoinensis]KAG6720297.1 hypothetical protein I3842_03G052800 [Carya illinoinensis]KAG7985948.1 hypothetical protein I3843_03G053700 [Carya illinoinensis]
MEANRKRRGFIKGKLMSFQRAAKPSSIVQYTSKLAKPSQSSPSTASVGFLVQQDYVVSQPNQKVSFIVPADDSRDLISSQYDSLYGIAADETVDTKAATYISSVQERFKLERMKSEHKKCQVDALM